MFTVQTVTSSPDLPLSRALEIAFNLFDIILRPCVCDTDFVIDCQFWVQIISDIRAYFLYIAGVVLRKMASILNAVQVLYIWVYSKILLNLTFEFTRFS